MGRFAMVTRFGTPVLAVLAAAALTSGFAPVADAGPLPSRSPRPTTPERATTTTTPGRPVDLAVPDPSDRMAVVTDAVRGLAGYTSSDRLGAMRVDHGRKRVDVYWKGPRPAALRKLAGKHGGVTVVLHRARISERQLESAFDRLPRTLQRRPGAPSVCEVSSTSDASGIAVTICYRDSTERTVQLSPRSFPELQRRIPDVPIVRITAIHSRSGGTGATWAVKTWQGRSWWDGKAADGPLPAFTALDYPHGL